MREKTEADIAADLIRASVAEEQDLLTWSAPRPFISEIDMYGKVLIIFTEPIKDIPDVIDLTTLEFEEK